MAGGPGGSECGAAGHRRPARLTVASAETGRSTSFLGSGSCGWTENDTFRSNQVREGYITRDRALELAESENAVRWDRIREYLELVGVSLDEAKVAVDTLSDRARRRYAGR